MSFGDAVLALRVIVPFEDGDVAKLDAWWREQAPAFGVAARIERAVEIAGPELTPDTLLLGWERGLLEDLVADGSLATPLHAFGFESWSPVWSVGGGSRGGGERDGALETEAPDSFLRLLDPAWRGRIQLRNVTFESPEGLILGDLARRLDRMADDELRSLVIASYEAGTILGAHMPNERLLEAIAGGAGGAATIAPVRAAVLARRAGLAVSFTVPREGFLALELAAAATQETSPALRGWLEENFDRAVAPQVAQLLEREPAGPLATSAPEWLRMVAKSRSPIERATAGKLRIRLAQLYGAAPPTSALPDSGWLERSLDTILLTVVVIAVLLFWRRERRSRSAA